MNAPSIVDGNEGVDGWALQVTQHRRNQHSYGFVRADAAAAAAPADGAADSATD